MKKIFKLISIAFITSSVFCFSGCAAKNTNESINEDTAAEAHTSDYNAYTGKYQLAPNFIITIAVKDGGLFAQATGQPGAEIFPESKDKFYYKVVAAKIQFNRNANGIVESLTLFQSGREMPAKKLNS